LISRLEESQRRENQLKRRLDDTEREKTMLEQQLAEGQDGGPPHSKKMRVCFSFQYYPILEKGGEGLREDCCH